MVDWLKEKGHDLSYNNRTLLGGSEPEAEKVHIIFKEMFEKCG